LRKFKRAVTDSDTENCVRYDPANKPGVANLMTIYSAVTGKSFDEIETLEAALNKGDHTSSVADIINLVHNLDCYDLHPGVTDDETLGRIYVEDMELLEVPDNVLPYFDFEAYGRDMRINEGGHFAPTGYLTRSGDFKEVYHGIEDIPAEHRIFAYPKLNIREQMAAYKEVIDRSSLEGERLHPRKEHDDR
jgi:hypothetical protein